MPLSVENANINILEYFQKSKPKTINKNPNKLLLELPNKITVLFKYETSKSETNPTIKLSAAFDILSKVSMCTVHLKSTTLYDDIIKVGKKYIKIKPKLSIGVIIDFSRNFYCKLYYDVNFPYNLGMIIKPWTYTLDVSECKKILLNDYNIGYDIFVLDYDGGVKILSKFNDHSEFNALYSVYGPTSTIDTDSDLVFDIR